MRELVEEVMEEELERAEVSSLTVLVGTMIELPRAAVCADEIAAHADFFSFGTNDLTQTTLGLSRDDAEGKFLAAYVEDGVIAANPFQTLDVDGVGALVRMGSEKGRAARAGLKIGVCGEHGGDPASVRFFHDVGVDYVSCSPFRVPLARLSAAQAVLEAGPARPVGPPVAAATPGCEHGAVENPSQAVELRRLADQHAALHRVASLVARSDVGADRIVAVATEEVGRLLGAESATMVRYGDDGAAVIVGGWSADAARQEPVGLPVQLDDGTALAQVWQTGLPSRVDDYRPLRGPQVRYLRHTLGLQAAVAAPIMLRGRLWGAVSAATVRPEPFPPETEHRLAGFAALLAQALANSEAARELAASRHRLVEAGDAERRRLERNLHDGAQMRLVSVALSLALLERRAHQGRLPSAADLAGVRAELAGALEELRELARGLHPAVLADHGLRAALPALAARSSLCVDVDADVDRAPEPVEVAAYFVASEALANAAKHGHATRAEVVARREDGDLRLTVSDDGVGGAALGGGAGTGLQGLADRVEALGGRFDLRSRAGEGTCLDVRLPLLTSPLSPAGARAAAP